jgi:hypothetical protein
VVVAVGETDTPTPLVTAPIPWSIEPVPPLNVGVSVAECPLVTVEGDAAKEAVGAATTVNPKFGLLLFFHLLLSEELKLPLVFRPPPAAVGVSVTLQLELLLEPT